GLVMHAFLRAARKNAYRTHLLRGTFGGERDVIPARRATFDAIEHAAAREAVANGAPSDGEIRIAIREKRGSLALRPTRHRVEEGLDDRPCVEDAAVEEHRVRSPTRNLGSMTHEKLANVLGNRGLAFVRQAERDD